MRRVNKGERARLSLTLNGRSRRPRPSRACCCAISCAMSCGAIGMHVGCEHGVCGGVHRPGRRRGRAPCLTLAVQAEAGR